MVTLICDKPLGDLAHAFPLAAGLGDRCTFVVRQPYAELAALSGVRVLTAMPDEPCDVAVHCRRGDRSRADTVIHAHMYEGGVHPRALIRKAACVLGVELGALSVPESVRAWAETVMPGGPWAAIVPFTRDRHKPWLADRWCAVVSGLRGLGYRVVTVGCAMASRLASALGADLDLTGRDTPLTMLGLLQRVRVVVGLDTGPIHWASLLGTPVVGLYGATSLAMCGPLDTSHCIEADCMDAITPDMVTEVVHGLG
jgi:ADP-heptose:LPS heptosyltransferase